MILRFARLAAVFLVVTGCASIDFDYPRSASSALSPAETTETFLGGKFSEAGSGYPESYSGFYPLPEGVGALAARLQLARRAERSIDAQYYLIKNDIVGRAFVLNLLQAADRGVRVRLLIDDMFTSGYDVGLAALDAHPNFELRIYNPFYRGTGGRARSSMTGFSRINRRMHNKSFTIDNQMTIIGGRNIADEYFGAREDRAFGDMDVVAVGPIVEEVSSMFDTYWNHETALPVAAFVKSLEDPEAELEALRNRLGSANADIRNSDYANAVQSQMYDYMTSDENTFGWAPYELVYDSPDKGIKKKSAEAASITTGVRRPSRAPSANWSSCRRISSL